MKPYPFVASKDPFKMQLEQGLLTGFVDEKKDIFHRFTRPILVKKGDTFALARGKVILNGKPVQKRTFPGRRRTYKIGWAAKKIRLAVFRADKAWIAADTRSYNVSQGNDPLQAIRNLIETLRYEREMEQDLKKKGKRVIRWHVERTPGTKKDMREMEKKAKKAGLFLSGVEWK